MQPQQQLFGRTAGRSSAIGWGPGAGQTTSAGPDVGPGSYDLSASGALRKSVSSSVCKSALAHGPSAAGAAGVGSPGSGAAAGAGFGSTGSRFEDTRSASPGPGKACSCAAVPNPCYLLLWPAKLRIIIDNCFLQGGDSCAMKRSLSN